ncbi:TPA: hypothetical protein ACTL7P_000221 [Pseudomonas aeruginosa]|uniref:hypothetical protein n=2 Tax=Pseudomonas aeruginosa TaxID=287 RepID=UPI001AAF0FE5|nr:hypothetical protein [Pseudomonas aeruginosa]EKX9247925.1 hypothetical protein [Pseudomonas aeruginosa]MBO2857308.1 hypothetical protein [Pseudomonas aeruginosa]MBO8395507.1 hypothetical protein [Pseudomonas aeruginosa]HBO7621827.1 hypothetical protein [Pseudomonas aeruginosa]HBO7669781.1 hypothetical protein [Pseudomonas aeruginosa]
MTTFDVMVVLSLCVGYDAVSSISFDRWSVMAKKTGVRKKTETFTTRLEPKERYVLELLSRISNKSIAKTLEEGIGLLAHETRIRIAGRPLEQYPLSSVVNALWSPQEWHRLLNMLAVSPGLLNYSEQCKVSILLKSKPLCDGARFNKDGALMFIEVVPALIETAWPLIEERAERMAEGDPAPPPTLKEIQEQYGSSVLPKKHEDGLTIDYSTFFD